MPNTILQYPPAGLRPKDITEWLGLITSAIGELKGMDWFENTSMTIDDIIRFIQDPHSLGNGFVPFYETIFITSNTGSFTHNIDVFNKNLDILWLFKNSGFLMPGIDYSISEDGKTITSLKGDWEATAEEPSEFNIVVLTSVNTNNEFVLTEFRNSFTANSDNMSIIPIGISEFNKNTDRIVIYQKEGRLHEDIHYTISEDSRNINLLDYTVNTGTWFVFYVHKNVRKTSSVMDGGLIADGTVGMEKLSNEVKQTLKNIQIAKIMGVI